MIQKRCFCFILSVVVLSGTGGMVNAGWWSGALEDIVISDPDEGILHVVLLCKLSYLQNRECFYIFSTDGGNTWTGSEDEYELISWDAPGHFFDLNDVSICLDRESMPYVVWREVNLTPPLLEVHISAFHE